MIPLIPTPYLAIGLAAVLAITNLFSYMKGREHVGIEFAQYRTRVDAASAEADRQNQTRQLAAEQAARKVADDYRAGLDSVRRDYASRLDGLQRGWRDCETLSITARATAGLDARPADARSAAPSFESACVKLEQDCAETTLMTRQLQRYVAGVCK